MDDCVNSHIVVANIQQLASSADRWLSQFPSDFFDLVIIDEGHHVAAESWQKVVRAFPQARFVSLTATPFRADNKELLGDLIYRYPFARAMLNGYIKHIVSALSTSSRDHLHRARREATPTRWTRSSNSKKRPGSVAGSRCRTSATATSPRRQLRSSRRSGRRLASLTRSQRQRCRSITPIKCARSSKRWACKAETIHSRLADDRKAAVLAKLRNNQIDVIVQVAMLGEGFDHPPLSVAAIFRP